LKSRGDQKPRGPVSKSRKSLPGPVKEQGVEERAVEEQRKARVERRIFKSVEKIAHQAVGERDDPNGANEDEMQVLSNWLDEKKSRAGRKPSSPEQSEDELEGKIEGRNPEKKKPSPRKCHSRGGKFKKRRDEGKKNKKQPAEKTPLQQDLLKGSGSKEGRTRRCTQGERTI